MKLFKQTLLTFAALFFCSSVFAAATLQISENGILTGATGVNVAGVLFDVKFRDGSCISLYSSCDKGSVFPGGYEGAEVASHALIEQVFVGQYLASPQLINGCTSTANCIVLTLAYVNSSSYEEMNWLAAQVEPTAFEVCNFRCVLGITGPFSFDSTSLPMFTNAVWSVSSAPIVPIPAAAWLFGSGLIAFIGIARSKSEGQ